MAKQNYNEYVTIQIKIESIIPSWFGLNNKNECLKDSHLYGETAVKLRWKMILRNGIHLKHYYTYVYEEFKRGKKLHLFYNSILQNFSCASNRKTIYVSGFIMSFWIMIKTVKLCESQCWLYSKEEFIFFSEIFPRNLWQYTKLNEHIVLYTFYM